MQVVETEIPDVKVFIAKRHGDHRGFFSETFRRSALAEAGLDADFVQDNHTLSAEQGTIRGLHYQVPPFAQHKLVRVICGAILDVAVDLRRSSPTFGRHAAVEISAEAWNQILVPVGFAHGFCTLAPDTQVLYKVTAYYAPDHDRGLLWNDPDLGIAWPVPEAEAVLSERDRNHRRLKDLADLFD